MTVRRGVFWPLVLIALGLLFLLSNYGFISGVSWVTIFNLWPLLLILIGLDVAFARRWPLPALAAEILVIAAGLVLATTQPGLGNGLLVFRAGSGGGEADVSVTRDGAASLSLRLVGGAGRYRVSGGATALVEAHSANADLRLVTSARERVGGRGVDVRIDQVGARGLSFRGNDTDIQVRIASDVPTSLDFNAGAGEFDVDLSDVRVTDARANTGASTLRLVLPKPSGDVGVRVNAGASNIVITVPEGVEARVSTTGGLLTLRSDNTRLGTGGTGGCVACGSEVETSGYGGSRDRVTVTITAGASTIVVR